MKNKAVKLSVCLFMLFVLFLGMNPVIASVDPLPAESTTVSYTSDEEPYKDYYDVSFLINTGEMTKRLTFGIESGKTFGSALPELPDGDSWQWVADDGTEFTANTIVLRDYVVSAVLPAVQAEDNDFMNGASGVLAVLPENGNESALKVNGNKLTPCVLGQSCLPDIWYFRYVGNCVPTANAAQGEHENLGPGCYYNIENASGKYIKLVGGIGVSDSPQNILVRNPGNGHYYLDEGGTSTYRLNIKYDSKKITYTVQRSQWGNTGSQFYFSNENYNVVTIDFNIKNGNLPAPHFITGVSGTTISLPDYQGSVFDHPFLGWSTDPDSAVLIENPEAYTMPEENRTLYAVFTNEKILWLHRNDGTDDTVVIETGDDEVELPEAERDGYMFMGWSANKDAAPDDENLFKAGDRYPITKDFDFLYAVWAKKVDVYLVGGDVDLAPALTILPWNGDFDLSAVQYDTENYTLAKWMYYDSEGGVHYAAADETLTGLQDDITLYAIWKNRALVTLDSNGGAFSVGGNSVQVHVNNGDTVGFGAYSVERSGCRLLGWALSAGVSDLNEVFTEYTITDAEAANNTTLYAVWGYQVSYNANGGSGTVPETQSVIAGSSINLPSFSGTKSGHAFRGWYTRGKYDNAGDLYDPGVSYTPDADITFYAQYTITITLNPADGQSVSPEAIISSVDGARIDLNRYTAVYQYGTLYHQFLGWGWSYTSTAPINNSYQTGNSDRTLYALWDQDAILCYDANNGVDALRCERHARHETVPLIDPSYLTVPEGAEFTGWAYFSESTKPDADLSADAGSIVLPGRDVTLYAVWQDNRVTLTFDDNGGSVPVQNITAEYGTTFTMPNYHGTKEGHTFRGWAESSGSVSPAYTVGQEVPVPNKDKTYYAVWSKPYTITYVVQNGKTPAPQTLMAGSSIELPGEAEVGTRNGYVLKGWSLQQNGAVHYLPGGSFVVPVTDIKLYAIWQQEQIRIAFNGNGNTAGTVPAAITRSYADEFTVPDFDGAEKAGKTFVGWDTSNRAANAAYKVGQTYPMPASNTTLYAVWKDKVTISFDPNTGTGVMDTLKITGAPGSTVTLDDKYDLAANGSLTFVRWMDGDVSYTAGSVYTIPTEDRTLYAEWAGTVNLCFDENGGSLTAPECKQWDGVHDVSVPDYSGTKSGARFIGWATQPDIKSDSDYHEVYKPGAKYNFPGRYDQLLYAVWNTDYSDAARFGIRLDGRIPDEPGRFDTSGYTSKDGGNIFIRNAVKNNQWVTDTTWNIEQVGDLWYVPNAVTANLAPGAIPSAEQVQQMMQASGGNFDPQTQFVLWYVMKWHNNKDPYPYWHIDGVILERAPYVTLTYHQNLNSGKVTNMPLGFQTQEGASVTVGTQSLDSTAIKTPKDPENLFVCWHTNPYGDCSDENAYQPGDPLFLNQNTDLYAIWEPLDKTQLYLTITKEWIDNNDSDGKRPDRVRMILTGTNDYGYNKTETIELSGSLNANTWSDIARVPKFDLENHQINYSWSEEPVPDYTQAGIVTSGNVTTIKNKYEHETFNLTGFKVWEDFDNREGKRPSSVSIILLEDSVDKGKQTTASAENNWAWTFKDLPKYKDHGTHEIVYTVTDYVQDYEASYDTASHTLTNTRRVNLTFTKVWNDTNNESKRPESLKVYLMNGESVVREETMTKSENQSGRPNEWVLTFEDVEEITGYYVTEETPMDYRSSGDGMFDSTNNAKLTNTYKKVTVTITEHSGEEEYDGEEHTVTGYDVSIDNPLYTENDFTFTGEASVSGTNVGSYDMQLVPGDFTNNNADFDVEFVIVDGALTIKPAGVTVTITEHSDTVPYDGAEHTVTGYDVTSIQIAGVDTDLYTAVDFTFSGNDSVSGTAPGSYDMELKPEDFTNINNNFENVTFVIIDGQLVITPAAVTVTITEHSNTTVVYDGTSHTVTGYDVKSIQIGGEDTDLYTAADFTFSGNDSVSGTDAGSYDMELNPEDFTNTNTNFANVIFVIEDGHLVISPAAVAVTITGTQSTLPYDGEAHSVSGYTAAAESDLFDVNDIVFSGEAAASRTNVAEGEDADGQTDMGLTADMFSCSNPNFTVTFSVTDGYQKITPKSVAVTVTGTQSTLPYDGEEHTASGYTAAADSSLFDVNSDIAFSGSAAASRTYVVEGADNDGQTDMGLTADMFSCSNPNFTVTFSVSDGYQKITPINVTVAITGTQASSEYDGQPHTANGYTVSVPDGSPYSESYIAFSGTAAATRTFVAENGDTDGKTEMGLTAQQFSNTNPNFGIVTFTVTDGYQIITPRALTITADDAEKVYDGTPLTSSKITPDGLLDGDTVVSAAMSGSQTYYGVNEENTPSAAVIKRDGIDVSASYAIEYEPGKLTVTKRPLTITALTATKPYDGIALNSFAAYIEKGQKGYFSDGNLVNGDEITSVTFTGEQIVVGTGHTTPAAWEIKNGSVDVTDCYEVTPVSAELIITALQVTVTITGHTSALPYDGSEHSVSGYDVVIGNPLYPEAGFTFSGTDTAKRTDVGTTYMGLNAGQFNNILPNFDPTFVVISDGYQEITPINVTVTITGHHNTTAYDGAEHTVSGYDVEISNPLYKEADFTFSGTDEAKRTDAGTADMGLAKEQFANINQNFGKVTFNVTDGYQTITPIDVTVTIVGANNTTDYNGEEHTVKGYTASPSNALYREADFTFSGTDEAKRTDVGTAVMGLKAEQFENTNPNFRNVTFSVTDGYQTITPIDVTVTITGHSNTTAYDGGEHAVTGYDMEATSTHYTEADFTFSGTAEAKRTDAGTADMGLKAEQFGNTNPNFRNVTFNVTDGYQTITPIDVTVTVTGHNNTAKYDGNKHTVSGYDLSFTNALYTGSDFEFTGTDTAERTHVGTTHMGLAPDKFTNKNANFGNVTFVVADGYQTITPVDEVVVTITGHNNTIDYDGGEHSVSGYDVVISDLLYTEADFTFSGTAEAKRTDAGTTDMGLAAGQFENTNPNFRKVTFNVTDGYQTINPIDVTVTIKGHTATNSYTGDNHFARGYEVRISNPLYKETDFTFSGTAEASRTDVGTTHMGLKPEQFTNTNENFKPVTFNVTDGYQTVEPVSVIVTITGHTNTTDYDGKEHIVEGYDTAFSNPLYKAEYFSFKGIASAKRTDKGKSVMGLTAEMFENTNSNFSNVKFEVTDGYQEINPINVTVTITGHHNTTTYDGNSHTVRGYDLEISSPFYTAADISFNGNNEAVRTVVGTTEMGLKAEQFSNTNPNFAEVTFKVVTDGYQTIDQKIVTVNITGHSSRDPYDGNEHVTEGYSVSISDPLYTEADFSFSGTAEARRTNVIEGAAEDDWDDDEFEIITDWSEISEEITEEDFDNITWMGLSADQFENINENFSVTFNITKDGYQAILPIQAEVIISGGTLEVSYDGKEHTVGSYTAVANNPLYDLSGILETSDYFSVTETNAGVYSQVIDTEFFENHDTNFTSVIFKVENGTLTITPIDVTVTITGHNNTADYDGAEHSVEGYDVTNISDPLFTEADIVFSGTAAAAARTDAGSTPMNLTPALFGTNNKNFREVTFSVTDGYQKIDPITAAVTITGHHSSVTFDGQEHSVSDYDTAFSTGLYTAADFTFSGTAEAKRTNEGTTSMGLAADQFANKNRNFKDVVFNVTDGYQTIVPVNEVVVTITGSSNTSAYDGTEHSVSGYKVEISDPLYTEEYFTFSGTAEAKRTDAGTTEMGLKAEQFANTNANFAKVTFNVTDGYQEITPIDVTVTITGANNTADYDGKEHKVSGYTAVAGNKLYDVTKDFTFSGMDEAARTNAGTTNMGLAAGQFTNTNPNFGTVTFEVTDGYQTVSRINATVTITGHNETVEYNGEEHSAAGYDVVISDPLYKEADFTFSGTAEAKRTNSGKTVMGLLAAHFANTNPNFETVTFIVTDGYVEVTPVENVVVAIIGSRVTADYDGDAHTAADYIIQIGNPLYTAADFTFSGQASVTRTDAGTTYMGLAVSQFTNKNPNFKNVIFGVNDGWVTIDPIDVTVTITGANNATDYDGSAHSVSGYKAEADNELYDVKKDFTFSGSAGAVRTDAGTTYMELAAEQFANTNPNFANVTFNVTDGYQTVDPIDVTVTITGHNNTADYDGKEHTVTGYDVVISDPLYKEADFTFSGTAEVKRTDFGTTDMGLSAGQFANINPNFANVTFDVTDGYQTIDPIDVTVTITGHSSAADYDGTEYTVTGYDVVISDPLYKEADFTFSGRAEAKRTDAGTTGMGLAEEQFANINTNFRIVTFNVTDGSQTINPIDVTVTITGHHNTAVFNGAEHTVTGYDASIGNPLYKEADFTFSGTAEARRTDVGTTSMGLAKDQFTNTNTNFGTVTFNVTDGYQTITAVDEVVVTITGHNNTTDYDGEEHDISGYEVEISDPLYTEDYFTFSGSAYVARTAAGTTYMGLAEEQFVNNNTNFAKVTFVVADGYQTISPISTTVIITGHSSINDYDGEAHSVSGYDVSINNPLYKENDFTFSGTDSATRTAAGTTEMGLKAEQFTNTNPNFSTVTFSVTDGYQKIDPINVTVTITGHNNTADYDGEEHSVTGYDVKISDPLYTEADFTFSGTAEARRTDAGTTDMGLAAEQFVNNNTNFGTVTFNVTDGYQTVDPIDVTVTITGHNNTTDYDGEEHGVSGYYVEFSDPLYTEADFIFSGTAEAKRTDAGTTDMGLKAEQFENTNLNFGTVTFNVTDGYQTVDPIDVTVTITGHNSTVDYDGEEHSVSGYDVQIGSKLYTEADFTFSGTAEAKRTDAGTTDMGLKAEQFANTNRNFSTVTFNVTDGYQKIDPIDVTVTITGHSNTTDYDGEEHSVEGYDVQISNSLYTEADFTFSGTAEAKRTDAGTTDMGLKAEQFANTSGNFGTVTFSVTDGYQKIDPINVTVTITGHKNTTDYDGEEHSVEGYDVQISNPLYTEADFTFSGTAEAARTDAGTTEMGLAAAQFTNNNPNFGTVTFNVTDGYQTVDPINVTVTITGSFNTADYDGKEHLVSGYIAKANTDLYDVRNDFTFSGTAEVRRTDAGTTNMGLAAEQFTNTNPNFRTVTFSVTDGYQTVDPIDVVVTVTGQSSTVNYDGAEHTVSGYTAVPGTSLYTEADFTFSGTAEAARTDAGTTEMGLAAEQFANINPNFRTVTFNVTDGYQTVEPINVTVTITGRHNTTIFDGSPHTVLGYDVKFSNRLYTEDDFTFSGTAEASRTSVGTTAMNLNKDQFANVSGNFRTVTFNVTDGYQTVTAIDKVFVTITGHFNTADYDGEEHEVSGYDVEISDPLYTEEDFTFSGTAEAARTDAGTTEMGLAADQFTNINENFKTVVFNVTDGYQTIEPIDAVVTITGRSSTTAYDGARHSVSGYDVEFSTTLYTEADFTFSGEANAARRDAGTTEMGLKADQFANTNPNFGTVTFNVTDGYQTVTPIDVTVTIIGHNNTAAFDGEEHTVSGYDVKFSNKLYTEADFSFSGSAEARLADAGTANMGLAAEQFTNNNANFRTVTFVVTDGYQTIEPIDVTVTITGHNSTADYDGEEHSVSGYEAAISNKLYTEADFTFSSTAEAARTDAGTTEMGLAAEQFANTNTNFGTVTFVVTDGYQTVDPIDAAVTITGHKNTTDYDGEEHSVSGYDVEISNKLYTEADFTFSGTAEAARTDAGTTDMSLTAEQFANTNPNFRTVTFNVTDGYQKIDPVNVTVTITGHTDTSAEYDGEEHVVSGYDVVISSPLYTEADFTFSGTAEASRTDAGTTVMGLTAEQFANTNPNFRTVTFVVSDGYQTVDPIDVTVTITGRNNTADYDGEEHTVSGYEVEISDPLYTEADFTFNRTTETSRRAASGGMAEASRTDAGTTDMGLAVNQFANTNPNFRTVTFIVTDGYQKIDPIDVTVTITGHTDTGVRYDGEAHTVSGYDVEISDPLYTEADFTFSGTAEASRTDAGTTNMGLNTGQFANTNPNFRTVTFVVTDGYQTIDPIDVTVTITGHNNTAAYNGVEHAVTGYDVEISDPLYKEAYFTFSGSDTARRTDAGTTNMGLAADRFTNINPNFRTVTFLVTDGYQTIEPIDVTVTITGHNNTAAYDGTAHSVRGYEVEISDPLYKEAFFTFSGTAEARRTDFGTTLMGLTEDQFSNTNANFSTVTFVVSDGYQTIEPIEVTVTITGHNHTDAYDGEEHTVSGYDVEFSNRLYTEADFTFSGTAEAGRTDAGTTFMGLTEDQFSNRNDNFEIVNFVVTDGYQTVNPVTAYVNIIGHHSTVVYDGAEHSVSGYDVEINDPLYSGEFISFSGTAEAGRTETGRTDMNLDAGQFANTSPNFSEVFFNVTDGYQIITGYDEVVVTITGRRSTVDFDGEEHTVSGYDVEISDLLYTEDDFTFTGTAEAARTDAGTSLMGLTAEQFINNNPNFGTVTFVVTDGYQTVNPIDVTVTITGHNNTADYDGEEHSVSGYDAEISEQLYTEDDFTFTGTAEAARTDAGTTNMGLAAEQFENTNTNFSKVTFVVKDGYQKIDPINVTVTITGHTGTHAYDGGEHGVSGYDMTSSTPLYGVEDYTFSGNSYAARTDAGRTPMGLTADRFVNNSTNFNTVTFNVTDGYYEITPINAEVTIRGHRESFKYNGRAHTVSGYDVETDNPLYKGSDIIFGGNAEISRTLAGDQNMGLAAAQFANGNPNFANVVFHVIDGGITVRPIDVTVRITGHNDIAAYDGEEHSVSGFDVETSSALYTAADFEFRGSANAACTDAGTTAMDLSAEQFVNTNPNFANVTFIIVTDGYLTVRPLDVTVTITGASDTVVYDGEEHQVTGYTASADNALYDVTKDFTFSGTAEAARTDAGTTVMGMTAAQFKNTNPNFGKVTFDVTDGYQTVSPLDITVYVLGSSGSSPYDGEPHTVSGFTVTADSPLYDVTKDFSFSGSDNAARTDAGITFMGLKPEQFRNTNSNFGKVTFDVTDGYQQVDQINAVVTITGNNLTTVYNGTENVVSGFTAETENALYDLEHDFTFSGIDRISRKDAGTTEMGLNIEQFVNTNPNFAEVIFEVTDGYVTVTPKEVTVTVDPKTKEFGQADEELTAVVEGVLEGDQIEFELIREDSEEPGEHPITVTGETEQGSYVITYVPSVYTITFNPESATVVKVWDDDNNRDGIRPVALNVVLHGSDGSEYSARLSDSNNWTATFEDLPIFAGDEPVEYSWTEEEVEGYTAVFETDQNVTTITNTHEIARTTATVRKVWDDMGNEGNTRPSSLGVRLMSNGTTIAGITLNDENSWTATVSNLPVNENGKPVDYTWAESSVKNYYVGSAVRSGNNMTFTNSNIYRMTVHYRYADGRTAAEDAVRTHYLGQKFAVDSPDIFGYTANQLSLVGEQPARDTEFTVVYVVNGSVIPDPLPVIIIEPEPLPEEPEKEVPDPRVSEPDEEHPVVVPEPSELVDIDDLETALGLGDANIGIGGLAFE